MTLVSRTYIWTLAYLYRLLHTFISSHSQVVGDTVIHEEEKIRKKTANVKEKTQYGTILTARFGILTDDLVDHYCDYKLF